jgi:hypothetical protein
MERYCRFKILNIIFVGDRKFKEVTMFSEFNTFIVVLTLMLTRKQHLCVSSIHYLSVESLEVYVFPRAPLSRNAMLHAFPERNVGYISPAC